MLRVPQKIYPLILLQLFGNALPLTQLYTLCALNLAVSRLYMIRSHNLVDLLMWSRIRNNTWLLLASLANLKAAMIYLTIYAVRLALVLRVRHRGFKILNVLAITGLPPFPLFGAKLFLVYQLERVFGAYVIVLLILSTGVILGQVQYFGETLHD